MRRAQRRAARTSRATAAGLQAAPPPGPTVGTYVGLCILIEFPDVPGYLTLKCDLHMHTVFSDGSVWPNIRVQEALRDGLDAIVRGTA